MTCILGKLWGMIYWRPFSQSSMWHRIIESILRQISLVRSSIHHNYQIWLLVIIIYLQTATWVKYVKIKWRNHSEHKLQFLEQRSTVIRPENNNHSGSDVKEIRFAEWNSKANKCPNSILCRREKPVKIKVGNEHSFAMYIWKYNFLR